MSCFFRVTQSSQLHKYRALSRLSLRTLAYSYKKFAHTYACAHSAHVLAFAWVLVWARGMKRDGAAEEGKERTAGEARFSLRGWGFRFGFPSSPSLQPGASPAASPIIIASLLLPFPARGRGETGGVRCEGWPWINTAAGRGGVRAIVARAYAASSRGGPKERDTLRQFIAVTLSASLLVFFFFDTGYRQK